MTALVRPAVPSDLPGVMTIERASFPTDAWSESSMRATLRDRDTVFVVAQAPDDSRLGDRPLDGYGAVLVPRRADADVLTLAVAADARGAGLGRTLLETLLAAARDRLAPRVFLEVRDDNEIARRLYSSVGFAAVGRRPRYYQPDDVDAVTMRLDLAGGANA